MSEMDQAHGDGARLYLDDLQAQRRERAFDHSELLLDCEQPA